MSFSFISHDLFLTFGSLISPKVICVLVKINDRGSINRLRTCKQTFGNSLDSDQDRSGSTLFDILMLSREDCLEKDNRWRFHGWVIGNTVNATHAAYFFRSSILYARTRAGSKVMQPMMLNDN